MWLDCGGLSHDATSSQKSGFRGARKNCISVMSAHIVTYMNTVIDGANDETRTAMGELYRNTSPLDNRDPPTRSRIQRNQPTK